MAFPSRSSICVARSVIACAVSLSLSSSAYAAVLIQPDEPPQGEGETAEGHLDAAAEAYEAGEFHGAISHFEAAYALNGDPSCLFNIGRVHEEAGELASALTRYEEFVLKPGVSLENRAMANERIQVLREVLETTTPSETPPPPQATTVPPQDTPPPQPQATAPSGRGLIIAGAATGGAGVVGVVVGGVFQALSRSTARSVDSASTPGQRDGLEAAALREATVGDALLISGAVLIAAGVPMLAVGLVRRKRSNAVAVLPGPGGVTVRF